MTQPFPPHAAASITGSSYALAHFKSFGDLTIAAASLRRLPAGRRAAFKLLIAPHLRAMSDALQPVCATEALKLTDADVPSIFDIKKRGVRAAVVSAIRLRRALQTAAQDSTLVFERIGWREKFIAGQKGLVQLPTRANVYLAHDAFFEQVLGEPLCSAGWGQAPQQKSRVALCPVSRVAAKNLPLELMDGMARRCREAGFEPVALRLDGEAFELPAGISSVGIPRRFDALAHALSDFAGVISADSLPAHLAEYVDTAAFVASPVPNAYWLPRHAFERRYWGLFQHPDDLLAALRGFLETLIPPARHA